MVGRTSREHGVKSIQADLSEIALIDPVRRARALVVATVFGLDDEEICHFDSRALQGRIAPTKTSSSSLQPADRDVPGELRAAAGATGRERQEICSEMRFDALV